MGRNVLALLAALTVAGPAAARADPVVLLKADSQAFLQDNGAMDVIYSLTFRDNGSRRVIRKVGQFYEPVRFTRAWLRHGERKGRAVVSALGGGYHRVALPFATSPGEDYILELHFRSNHRFADPTSRGAQQLLAVAYNPVRWVFPVQRSVVKLVLPLPLPAGVERHADITPAMVDGLGVLTEAANKREQDRWAFVYTDYRDQRRLTVYAARDNLPRRGVHGVKLYIPRGAMPRLSAGKNIEAAGGPWPSCCGPGAR